MSVRPSKVSTRSDCPISSTIHSRGPERAGLSVLNIPEEKVIPGVFRGATPALSALSERPERVRLDDPKGAATQADQRRDCNLINLPIALEFAMRRDVLTRGIAGLLFQPSGLVPMPWTRTSSIFPSSIASGYPKIWRGSSRRAAS